MLEKEIINKIKEAEKKAAELIKKTQDESNILISDAKLKAKDILKKKESDAKERAKSMLKALGKELQGKISGFAKDREKKKGKLREKAGANINEAVEFVKDRFFEKWKLS